MSLVFHTIRYKNFLSTGNDWTEIKLDRSKSTLIVGSVGSGKSSVTEAIIYCLFGKPYRKIKIGGLVNSINKKGLLTECEFSIGKHKYLVRRGQKPGIFEIWCDGSMLNQNGDNRDYQAILEKNILRMSLKVFTQVAVLGAAEYVPFMELSAGARREMIEGLLDIDIFSRMNILLKQRLSETKQTYTELKHQMSLLKQKMELSKSFISTLQDDKAKKIEALNETAARIDAQIEASLAEIEAKTEEMTTLQETISHSPSVSHKLQELRDLGKKFSTKLKSLEKTIAFFTDNSECPTCNQSITDEFRNTVLEDKESQKLGVIRAEDQLQSKLNDIQSEVDRIDAVREKINTISQYIIKQNANISSNRKYLNQIKKDIAGVESENSDLAKHQEEYQKTKEESKDVASRYEQIVSQVEMMTQAASVLKDDGVKAQVIKQYIPIINRYVERYLAALDFFVGVEFDTEFNESFKSRGRDEFSYFSFSEGEKKRISMAIMLAMRSVAKIKNSVNTSLLFLDEVVDSNLDEQGLDDMFKLFDTMDDTNLFVISHRSEILQDKIRSMITFEKKGMFSVIKK
jgi:DNA repair exonuclease SbcCD ATPase subunit